MQNKIDENKKLNKIISIYFDSKMETIIDKSILDYKNFVKRIFTIRLQEEIFNCKLIIPLADSHYSSIKFMACQS